MLDMLQCIVSAIVFVIHLGNSLLFCALRFLFFDFDLGTHWFSIFFKFSSTFHLMIKKVGVSLVVSSFSYDCPAKLTQYILDKFFLLFDIYTFYLLLSSFFLSNLNISFQVQVYLFVYWHWSCCFRHIMLWLHRRSVKKWLLPVFCIPAQTYF